MAARHPSDGACSLVITNAASICISTCVGSAGRHTQGSRRGAARLITSLGSLERRRKPFPLQAPRREAGDRGGVVFSGRVGQIRQGKKTGTPDGSGRMTGCACRHAAGRSRTAGEDGWTEMEMIASRVEAGLACLAGEPFEAAPDTCLSFMLLLARDCEWSWLS